MEMPVMSFRKAAGTAWKPSGDTFSFVPSTISKENTNGESARLQMPFLTSACLYPPDPFLNLFGFFEAIPDPFLLISEELPAPTKWGAGIG
jgi:hypothetical protein